MNKNITRIALTGGPCAGKTTALAQIIEHFSDLGYLVYALPETPTLFSKCVDQLRHARPSVLLQHREGL